MGTRCICPHCRTTFTVDDIDELVGTKIRCARCNGKILLQAPPARNAARSAVTNAAQSTGKKAAPVQKVKKPDSEIIELDQEAIVDEDPRDDDFAVPDVEYGVDDLAEGDVVEADLVESPVQLHRLRAATRPKQKKKSEESQEAAGGGRSSKRRQVWSGALFLWIAAGAVALCTVAAVLVLVISGGGSGGAKFQPPEEYVDFAHQNLELSAEIPKGWEQDYGGGSGGVPIFAKFKSGKVSIEVRESRAGGAMGAAQLAMQQQGGEADATQAVESIHESQRTAIAANFNAYKEDAEPRPIKTRGFGTGMVSDFDADQGMFAGGRVKGCRATVLSQLHQFNVICKCPAGMFDDLRPVFEKIIASLGG
jgi:DNA-directed RNA polymerase subunit RPC12/RpoP